MPVDAICHDDRPPHGLEGGVCLPVEDVVASATTAIPKLNLYRQHIVHFKLDFMRQMFDFNSSCPKHDQCPD